MNIVILKQLDLNQFEENTPAWHAIIDLSYFEHNQISVAEVAKVNGITEDDVMHNISELLELELITLNK